jgi:lysophospholipase L1-like esterase
MAAAASGKVTMRRAGLPHRAVLVLALAVTAAVVVSACSGPAPRTVPRQRVTSYYLALGDSLSQGVQPDAAGASVETGQGYPELVYAALRRSHPGLRLVSLGCPGETTRTMIDGGICGYPGGVSQLGAAVAFLRAHRGHMLLITIDIGANDPEDCGLANLAKAASCLGTGIPAAVDNLTMIMNRLRSAAGPRVRIVGMNYYLPELAEWRDGLTGQAAAWLTERLAAGYNAWLDRVYSASGARVANVFSAFGTADFSGQSAVPGLGTVPRNVALLCRWTWECTAPPRGPNQHANPAGYRVIAGTVLRASGLT